MSLDDCKKRGSWSLSRPQRLMGSLGRKKNPLAKVSAGVSSQLQSPRSADVFATLLESPPKTKAALCVGTRSWVFVFGSMG